MISPTTICYALKMTYDFLRGQYICERTECNRKRLDEFSDIIDEIDNGKLEIEDYERVQWTRFDANDPSTFPPKTDEYIVAIDGRSTSTTRKFSVEYAEFFSPEKITHWRPLPKPPVETEETK